MYIFCKFVFRPYIYHTFVLHSLSLLIRAHLYALAKLMCCYVFVANDATNSSVLWWGVVEVFVRFSDAFCLCVFVMRAAACHSSISQSSQKSQCVFQRVHEAYSPQSSPLTYLCVGGVLAREIARETHIFCVVERSSYASPMLFCACLIHKLRHAWQGWRRWR